MKITALAGGVGASKFLLGLARVMDPRDLTVIVNTGDDIELHGLKISPDLDIVTYTLADLVNPQTGWGFQGDTFSCLEMLGRYGRETWFHLGDRDLATHVHRTAILRSGGTLTQAAESIRRACGVEATILPMCDVPVPTLIRTEQGTMHFQEYLVRHRSEPLLTALEFQGIERAHPAPGVLEALARADAIFIAPSNPLISIGPILGVPDIRPALRVRREQVVAINPIVGGRSLKGPSDRMLVQLGYEASAVAVARLYQDIVGIMILDEQDAAQARAIESLGMEVAVTSTVMRTLEDRERLARFALARIAAPLRAART